MATTVTTAPGESISIAPKLVNVLGGLPEARVQLLFRKGVITLDRTLTVSDAYRIGMALCAAAGDTAP
jgi:hypothetical protein